MIHGPRTMTSPTEVPSCGKVRPFSSAIFISTPNTGRPALALITRCPAVSSARCLAFNAETVPSGLISVIPQPCIMVMPRSSNASVNAGGTATPPDNTPRKVVQPPQ